MSAHEKITIEVDARWRKWVRSPLFVVVGTLQGIAFSFCLYSGYIVSAPPRAAGSGTPNRCENSERNGFVPGK